MAIYRQIHVSFWQDPFVLDLKPEEKYFYMYLMTNSKTNQIGIYEIPKKIMEIELGYSIDRVSILLNKFISYKKILFSESKNELMLLNWCKYNWSSSPKVISLVNKELKNVKTLAFARSYVEQAKSQGHKIDSLSIEYLYSIDTESQEELELELELKEELEEELPQEEKEKSSSFDIHTFFQTSICQENPIVMEGIEKWVEDTDVQVVKKAIEVGAKNNKTSYAYVDGILRNWVSRNLTTIELVDAAEQAFEKQKANSTQSKKGNGRKEELPNWFDNPEVLPPQIESAQEKTKEELDREVAEMKRKLKEARA
ncbi:DnaD domain protein [Listeria weihenstephanensis]|uniref:DnaD domain protein n=1 Tax=Listeria weihenstephanensis TaxID=1006155 RepID=A0A841Z4I2_9LIST|nr:DnaD domain protein [Listeria weihenstephanensis]MBC1499367.1 DnaD domain protein [Listeria weihenstephanensis]